MSLEGKCSYTEKSLLDTIYILILSKSLLCCLPTDTPESVLQNSRNEEGELMACWTPFLLTQSQAGLVPTCVTSEGPEPTELNIYSVSFHVQLLFNPNHSIT